jgi:hypothetical protein
MVDEMQRLALAISTAGDTTFYTRRVLQRLARRELSIAQAVELLRSERISAAEKSARVITTSLTSA